MNHKVYAELSNRMHDVSSAAHRMGVEGSETVKNVTPVNEFEYRQAVEAYESYLKAVADMSGVER